MGWAGCGSKRSPTGPVVSLVGWVNDTADRPLANVRVEVVDGLSAGVFATTNTVGHYELPGVSEPFTVRATKDGYAPFTTPRSMQCGPHRLFGTARCSTRTHLHGEHDVHAEHTRKLPSCLGWRDVPVL